MAGCVAADVCALLLLVVVIIEIQTGHECCLPRRLEANREMSCTEDFRLTIRGERLEFPVGVDANTNFEFTDNASRCSSFEQISELEVDCR